VDDNYNYGIQTEPPPRAGRFRPHDRRLILIVAMGVVLGMLLLLAIYLMLWGLADAFAGPPVCNNATCSQVLQERIR
jgi:hypothetical protein